MENYENKKQEIENSNKVTKPEWQVPELTVISMDQTNSGVGLTFPNEGMFYSPS